MPWKLFNSSKRSTKGTARTSGSILLHWDKDTAIVFDPVKQKFYKDSVAKIEEEGNMSFSLTSSEVYTRSLTSKPVNSVPFQKIPIPRYDRSFDCYVQASNTEQRVFIGTIDLSKLGKTINLHRASGHIPELYIIGNVEIPT